jgi:hypothetical protein
VLLFVVVLKDRRIAPENKLAPYTHEGVPRQLLVWLNPGLFSLRSTSAPICSARSPSKMVSPHAKVKNLILSGARLIGIQLAAVLNYPLI